MRALNLALVFVLAGCAKQVGSVPFDGPGQGEATFPIAAGDVSFWTDIDVQYQDGDALSYQIEMLQNGTVSTAPVCDPLGQLPVKIGFAETTFNASHSRRGSGKMACGAKLATGGPVTVRVKLVAGRPTAKLVMTKADLVVKQ